MDLSLKKIVIVILILIVIVIGINLLIVWLRTNEGRKIAANSKPFKHQNSNPRLRVLFVGDSTAVGSGAKTPEDSLAGRFFKDHPNSEIINLGKNGLKTKELIDILEKEKEKYDLIIMQIGANDILRFTDLDDLEKDIQESITLAKRLGKNVVLLTCGNVGLAPFFPKPLGFFYTKRTRLVRDIFMRKAKENGIVYVDLFTEKDKDKFLQNPKKYYAKDMLHASSDGYGLWYQEFKKTFKEARLEL